MANVLATLSHGLRVKHGTVTRSDTTATELFKLPKNAIPLFVVVSGTTASDAGTTAVVDVGNGSTDDHFAADVNVKTNGAVAQFAGANMGSALTADTKITGKYSETGTASTTGGGWEVSVYYID